MKKKFRDFCSSLSWSFKCGQFGKDVYIKRGTDIYLPHYVSIGSQVRIGERCDFYARPRNQDLEGFLIQIGNGVHVGHRCTLAAIESVIIEDKVVIGNDVYISDHGHTYQDSKIPIIDQPVSASKPSKICRGSWIGAMAIILPGVTVGEHAVVGAGAVVTKDVEAFTVVVGNPSRVVRQYHSGSGEWERV